MHKSLLTGLILLAATSTLAAEIDDKSLEMSLGYGYGAQSESSMLGLLEDINIVDPSQSPCL